MGYSKHDFKGIKKLGATALFTAVASSPFGFLTNGLLGKITFFLLEKIANWLANQGLIILNVGAAYLKTNFEQKAFETAMQKAFELVDGKQGKLNPAEVKAIDDEVIKIFDDFAIFV